MVGNFGMHFGGGSRFTLCTVYGSNFDEALVLEQLNLELASWPTSLVLCGDFNINLVGRELQTDIQSYSGRKHRVFKALYHLLSDHGLIDIWGTLNAPNTGHTFYSHPHGKLVRLDYFFISPLLLIEAQIQVFPRITSDHAPVVLDIPALGINAAPRRFTFDRKLLWDNVFIAHMRDWIRDFFSK